MALILYCGHNATFVADIYPIKGAVVVRASAPVTMEKVNRNKRAVNAATHHLSDFPVAGFWRPDIGVFVVPADQLKEL